MRKLTEDESKIFFSKLAQYIGRNISHLVDNKEDPHVFVLHEMRVYYARESLARAAESVCRDKLCAVGTCFGKFTKTGKFRLWITCLEYLAKNAEYKVWIKKKAEMSYLYGNNALRSHVERTSGNIQKNQGVVVLSESGTALGFGVTVKASDILERMLPLESFVINQADTGEYLRNELTLV
ncbi:MAG: ribosome biogenesis protein NIP7 [Amphiamblys sp. WSBS2006]|nr:MAG: ribosome biogenesis protein NIP7 [Amphiamblys sp. WSBS2006]